MSNSVLEIDVGIMCACMPLFAPYLPKKERFLSLNSYFRSMRSRLLRSTPSAQASHVTGSQPQPQHGNVSDSELVHKNGAWVELDERKSEASSTRRKENARKEWFDGTTTVDQSVIDRDSKDASQMNYHQHQR
jgi:hypothetical protein